MGNGCREEGMCSILCSCVYWLDMDLVSLHFEISTIDGYLVVDYFEHHGETSINPPLRKGSPMKVIQHVCYA